MKNNKRIIQKQKEYGRGDKANRRKAGNKNNIRKNGELELYNIIYGDMGPEEIPNDIENTHIIIMDSDGMWNKAIKWDMNYFTKLYPNLNPYVKILEEISDKEYKSWIEKIKAYNQKGL